MTNTTGNSATGHQNGGSSQADDGARNGKGLSLEAQEGELHLEYGWETEICSRSSSHCTAGNVWDSTEKNSVPLQNGTLYAGKISNIPGIGKVVTHVDDANYTLINETLPGHKFAHGTVTRSLVISEGAISVRTVGVGVNTGRIAWGANYAASPYFKGVDQVIKADIAVQQLRSDVNSFFQ